MDTLEPTFGIGKCIFPAGPGQPAMTKMSSMAFSKAASLLTTSASFGNTMLCQKKLSAGLAGRSVCIGGSGSKRGARLTELHFYVRTSKGESWCSTGVQREGHMHTLANFNIGNEKKCMHRGLWVQKGTEIGRVAFLRGALLLQWVGTVVINRTSFPKIINPIQFPTHYNTMSHP